MSKMTEGDKEVLFNAILEDIAVRKMPLRKALLLVMSTSQFYKMLESSEDFRERYARATKERAKGIFDEILEIADTPVEGSTIKDTDRGVETTTGDMLGHRKLQIEARKWTLGKMNPEKYGDSLKVDAKVEGNISQSVDLSNYTYEQLKELANGDTERG